MTHICLLNTGFGQALRWGSKGSIEPKTSNIALRKATLMSNLVSRMPQCTLVASRRYYKAKSSHLPAKQQQQLIQGCRAVCWGHTSKIPHRSQWQPGGVAIWLNKHPHLNGAHSSL